MIIILFVAVILTSVLLTTTGCFVFETMSFQDFMEQDRFVSWFIKFSMYFSLSILVLAVLVDVIRSRISWRVNEFEADKVFLLLRKSYAGAVIFGYTFGYWHLVRF